MSRTSIDVIEEALGTSLVPAGWTARSLAEIDATDPVYRVPAISKAQFEEIRRRLVLHWAVQQRNPDPHSGCLLVCPRIMTPLHQYPGLDTLSWQIMLPTLTKADDAMIARKALLYSDGVVVGDPAELLAPRWTDEGWEERWHSAFYQLAPMAKLVHAGYLRMYPLGAIQMGPTPEQTRLEREQEQELHSLYSSPQWDAILSRLQFPTADEAAVYASWALGQFAWKNVVLPDATPWLPTRECLTALSTLGDIIAGTENTSDALTLARLSSKLGINLAKVSDDDMIALRRNEELFASWRRLVAELCLEVDRLAIGNAPDLQILVQAKQALWGAELERQVGRGGMLSGVFDASAIACGLITGGVAVASGAPAVLSAASALGGGLASPLIKLLGNVSGARGADATRRAVTAHFMALEG